MNAPSEWVMAIGDRTIDGLLVWSWQATILLTMVWLFLKLSRLRSPALRHHTWLFSLIALATLPLAGEVAYKVPPVGPHPSLNYVMDAPRAVVTLASRPSAKTVSTSDLVSKAAKPSLLGFFKTLL